MTPATVDSRLPSVEIDKVAEPESPGSPAPLLFKYDDGTAEGALGYNNGDPDQGIPPTNNWQVVFVNRFTPNPQDLPVTIDKVSILFPLTDSNLRPGLPFEVLVYLGPSGTNNGSGTTLVARKPIAIQPSDSMFQEIALDNPVRVESGDVWVGFTNTYTRSHETDDFIYPGAIDLNSPSQENSWFFVNSPNNGIHFDGGTSLADADFGAIISNGSEFIGNWLIRASGQSGATVELTWSAPDPNAGANPPPRFLQVEDVGDGAEGAPRTEPAPQSPGAVIGYKVYRSNSSPVNPSPNNIFASVPPTQTSARSATAASGSFYVVTACYASGAESAPSNEASGGIAGPAVTGFKYNSKKIQGDGTGWVFPVTIFLDNVGFTSATTIKNKPAFIRVIQKGRLENGQKITQYLRPGRQVLLTFRNNNGATTAIPFVVQ
jgi:hypothetical protein